MTTLRKFKLIAGPCLIEDKDTTLQIAEELRRIQKEHKWLDVIFKGSYRKANRTSGLSFRGIGDEEALSILQSVTGLKKTTDIHTPEEAKMVKGIVDIIQIPAFLSRQTELLEAAAETGLPVNIKKGQFMSYKDAYEAQKKVTGYSGYRDSVYITERGTTYGMTDLIVDFRNIILMKIWGQNVIYDVTHSLGDYNAGIELTKKMCMAAIAAGVDGLFIETHPKPEIARSDGKRMYQLSLLEYLISDLKPLVNAINK